MPDPIQPEDLVFHCLNVGFGDNTLIEFPEDRNGMRSYALVDCCDYKKTEGYLKELQNLRPGNTNFRFICATHPHYDHISGIDYFLKHPNYKPDEFWDSGFRHQSKTYMNIIKSIYNEKIKLVTISSGMEWYFGKVQVLALAPSIRLRNQYATYGVDMNNSSIVLRFEHRKEDYLLLKSLEYKGTKSKEIERQAGRSVVILTGDAEFDSWAYVTEEYPRIERTKAHQPLVKKMINHLACSVIKVAHHGSMHSSPLDVYEKMSPNVAIISTKQEISTKDIGRFPLERSLFPHPSAVWSLEEIGATILTTDGWYERSPLPNGQPKNPDFDHCGTITIVVPPGGRPRYGKLDDDERTVKQPLTRV